MNSKIKFIALSALAPAMTFTSVASQAAVDGSDVGVIDENGNSNNTVSLPSLTSAEVGATAGLVGTSVPFSVGPVDREACFNKGAVTKFDMVASGDSILNAPLLDQTVTSAEDTVVDLKAQLFHLDTTAPSEGSIGSTATFTAAYY